MYMLFKHTDFEMSVNILKKIPIKSEMLCPSFIFGIVQISCYGVIDFPFHHPFLVAVDGNSPDCFDFIHM